MRGGRIPTLVPTTRLGLDEDRLFVSRASVNPYEDQDREGHQTKYKDGLRNNRRGHDRPGLNA